MKPVKKNQMSKQIASSSGFGLTFVIILFFIILIFIFAGIITIRHIIQNFYPDTKTIEKMLVKGEVDKAYSLVYKSNSNSVNDIILKAKIHIALSLKGHSDAKWRKYGVNSDNWLDDENSRKALDLLSEALSIDSLLPIAYCLRGIVQKEMGMFDDAEQNLIKTLTLDSKLADCYLGLASLYILQNRYVDAENILKKSLEFHPDNPDIMKNIGFLYRFYIPEPESSIVWLNRYLSSTVRFDRDIGIAKTELRELMQRYPEVKNIDTSGWGMDRKFIARENTPFSKK